MSHLFLMLTLVAAVGSGLVLLVLAVAARARWQERARAAENLNQQNRRAHAIQNDIAFDPELRERVRRHFDQS